MASSKSGLVYCWISIVLMSLAISTDGIEDDGHQLYNYDSIFEKNIHKDVSYNFVEESMSWAEAQKSCEDRGGHLLRDLNEEVNEFLQTLSVGPGRWWVNQDTMSGDSMGGSDVNDPDHLVCTYLDTEPFRLVTTPNCSMSFGSLCTLDTNTHLKSSQAKHRHRRAITNTVNDLTSITTLSIFLEKVKLILKEMETTVEVLTKTDRVLYLKQIYRIVKLSLPLTDIMAPVVINSTSAMLMYTQECELDNMDDFEELITNAGLIYATVKNGPFTQEMPTGTMFVDSKTPEQLGRSEVGSRNGTYCQLPSFSALSGQLPSGSVNVQLFQFKVNPMQDKSNESITGTTCSFSLQKEDSAVKLQGLPENIEIFLPRPGASDPEVVSIDWKSGFSVTSSFNITDVNMTVIVTATPSKNVTLGFQLFPSTSNSTIQNATASANIGLKEEYRWLITPQMRKGGFSSWKVAILPINYTSSDKLTIKVSVFVTKCLFWDTDLEQWSIEGCMVGPKTKPSLTHCLCNHTTFFGSSFFVMPNQVDLSQTAALFATVNENYIVVVLLSCFFAVFLVVLAWAWYTDRKALRTRKMTLLEDNHPCAQYNYLVTFQTGHRRRAGTTAKVKAILYFEEGKTETYNLDDPEKPVFERGGVDVFLLSIPFSLGTLESIEIWHDNTGDPDWYLNRLTVQDLQTQEVTHFLCSTWLRGETCKRTFNSAKNNEIASFGDIFQTRTSTGFRDEHIWVSIVDPPRRSPFTRVQRVACCMSLLLCTMAINIMFWNLPKDEESPVMLKIGSFALTWQELMVAVESGLFMFPINILIITIFRHIKPRVVAHKEESNTIKNKAVIPASVSMNTIIQEIMDLLACLSKCPKNMLSKDLRSEGNGDLFWALNKVHDLIEMMTVESVGDPHWTYCSRFVLHSLSHVSLLLDHVGEKGCYLNEELRQARGTLSVLLKKAELASLRHAAQTIVIVEQPQKKKGWWLPWWFLFVGWALLFFMSGISTFFTLLYGFQYGKESSIQWVITLTLSLVQSIFILQPLKVVLVAIFFAMILRPVAVDENEEVELLLKGQKKRCEEYSGRSTS